MFKKKQDSEFIPSERTDAELVIEFHKTLAEYVREVYGKNPWQPFGLEFDDATLAVSLPRQVLHEIIEEMEQRRLPYDRRSVVECDRKWQRWIIEQLGSRSEPYFASPKAPRAEWWWWINRLDELTDEERSTL